MLAGWQYLTDGQQISWLFMMLVFSVSGLGALGALAVLLAPQDATKKKSEGDWAPLAFVICLVVCVFCFKQAMAIGQEAYLLDNLCRH